VGFVALSLAVAVAPQACSQKDSTVAKGQPCFLASDCDPGLVCVPQDNGTRICTDDINGIAGDGPMEAGADANMPEAGEGGGDAPSDSPPPMDSGQDTSPMDTGVMDTGGG
jgi:hypothetical protein